MLNHTLRGPAGLAHSLPSAYPRSIEQIRNIGPRYAIRLRDLRGWHIVTAVCDCCRRATNLNPWLLRSGRPDWTHLTDLERLLLCKGCGNREGNRLLVTMASRD